MKSVRAPLSDHLRIDRVLACVRGADRAVDVDAISDALLRNRFGTLEDARNRARAGDAVQYDRSELDAMLANDATAERSTGGLAR